MASDLQSSLRMILLIASKGAEKCAAAIQQAVNETTQSCPSLSLAASNLGTRECSVLVIDENYLETDPDGIDLVLKIADTAIPVFVNFAISGADRVVRDVRSALHRSQRERARAMRDAEATLRSLLTEPLTGILISCQLAMEVPALPVAAQARLRSVYQLAVSMRQRLESPPAARKVTEAIASR